MLLIPIPAQYSGKEFKETTYGRIEPAEECETDSGLKRSNIEIKNGANLTIPVSCSIYNDDRISCNRVKVMDTTDQNMSLTQNHR